MKKQTFDKVNYEQKLHFIQIIIIIIIIIIFC